MRLRLRGRAWLVLVGISWNLKNQNFSKICLITSEFSYLSNYVKELGSYWSNFHEISCFLEIFDNLFNEWQKATTTFVTSVCLRG